MKKAKIMLTAVAVFAVIGGAMAFKARTSHTFYRIGAQGQCTSAFQTTLTTLTNPGDETFTTRLATQPVQQNVCPIITVKETL